MQTSKIKKISVSAILIAISVALALVSELIPFFHAPLGGTFTICSMLPIVLISYMYGMKWGFLSAATYAILQIVLSFRTVSALFLPSSESYVGVLCALLICFMDYILAYTLLGLGGIFRNRFQSKAAAISTGSVVAIGFRYLTHIVSGAIFYGSWAGWLLTEDVINAYPIGVVAVIYSALYNGLYMIPEIIVTAIAAIFIAKLHQIKKEEKKK